MLASGLLLIFSLGATAPVEIDACLTACIATAERVPDTLLAQMRGGVELPNGLNVAIGIDIQTRVDGVLVLHTVYTSDGPNAGIRVFTNGTNQVPLPPGATTVRTSSSGGIPIVTVDRSPAGTTIVPGRSINASNVNVVNSGPETWPSGQGETPVPVTANGPSVAAAPGAFRIETSDTGAAVILASPSLEIRQLVGSATGIVVANAADNRSIETVSAINVELQGVSPQLLAGAFAAQRMAVESVLVRAPGGL
ncbi:hypothetical protein [Sphingomonas sp. M1-B02]|uniref:hypothetical protein n=1 Tax=Sphingomonas sp. M1-B02 TaxID=3114300 RepID=UPI00223FFECB|nr:hypothetical protein [Sphingomonas sp. S6-11]UZK67767.1 hypothetical protein OKW87_08045 [Sphingomonas sp. S6-11]